MQSLTGQALYSLPIIWQLSKAGAEAGGGFCFFEAWIVTFLNYDNEVLLSSRL